MEQFQKGDVVQCKSGGPPMTIQNLGEYSGIKNGACCVWFDGKNQKEAVFDIAVLTKVTQSQQPVARRSPPPFSRTGA